MGKLKYLSKNIALFTISNFVSKILVFLLVPFYTNVLSTYEYGIADIIQVTLLLFVPAFTVNIGEAALRFGLEYEEKRHSIFYIGIRHVIKADIIVAVICLIATAFASGEMRLYLLFFIVMFFANSLYEFLILFFQGSELVNIIVIGSVSCTLFTILCNLYFLLVLKIGLSGYLISQIIAFSIAAIIMILMGIKASVIKKAEYDKAFEKEMLTYSRPMIAYSTASWINNAVDRYFVVFLCGAAVNGIYGVAYKIPAILMVFQRIFAQAWQMSATKAHNDSNSDRFFSGMYTAYNTFMVVGCSLLIIFVRIMAFFLFRKEFYAAWKLVPPLLISVIFGALTGFLGSICLAHKDSKSMGVATGIGALVNVILNLMLIPNYEALGASIATGISYFIMCTLALIFVKKHTNLKVAFIKNCVGYFLIIIQSVIMILEIKYDYLICAVIFVVLCALNIKDIMSLFDILKSGKALREDINV